MHPEKAAKHIAVYFRLKEMQNFFRISADSSLNESNNFYGKFREIDLYDFTSYFGLDPLKFSGMLWCQKKEGAENSTHKSTTRAPSVENDSDIKNICNIN